MQAISNPQRFRKLTSDKGKAIELKETRPARPLRVGPATCDGPGPGGNLPRRLGGAGALPRATVEFHVRRLSRARLRHATGLTGGPRDLARPRHRIGRVRCPTGHVLGPQEYLQSSQYLVFT
jgi:hypothetical protein